MATLYLSHSLFFFYSKLSLTLTLSLTCSLFLSSISLEKKKKLEPLKNTLLNSKNATQSQLQFLRIQLKAILNGSRTLTKLKMSTSTIQFWQIQTEKSPRCMECWTKQSKQQGQTTKKFPVLRTLIYSQNPQQRHHWSPINC